MRQRWRRRCLGAALLAMCAPPTAERLIAARPTQVVPPRGPAVFQAAMLAQHNAARTAVGAPALRWSAVLAEDAAGYAETLALTAVFQHSHEPRGAVPEGENLFAGTRGAYRYEEMVDQWVAERRDYVVAPMPDFSRTGRWQDVAHYTQIVWARTTEFGCAIASNADDDYLVCRYTPKGNVVGRFVAE